MSTLHWLGQHAVVVRISTDEQCCVNCKHYHQHYVWSGQQYVPISLGHCAYPRLKHRSAEQICGHFVRKDGNDK